ncbi:class I SAM-dependent methyltransferase [Bacillus sp. FJAT-27445]|uniref:class I SAM-dependent methyltransferase n=1 Tax=Bacillus sp. FJAT-27445 TaxID=1679166 RepID=UPI000743CD76|nr:class I SAM-dependent methyltransferase [Bacillus sp. FJAT-27445]
MGKWFASLYDIGMSGLEKRSFRKIREKLLENASGRVLEIGSGSGINFPLYRMAERVDAIEPDPFMIQRSEQRANQAKVPVTVHRQNAQQLEFHDNSFDAVVATLVFCTIPDPAQALSELKRVSKPGATLLFFEHVKMPQPALAKLQEILNPAWRAVCGGCNLNRDTVSELKRAGIEIEKTETYYNGLFITIQCTNNKC